jgi:hypothetical protein
MKHLPLITYFLVLASLCSSCMWNHHEGDTAISISDTKSSFSVSAYYDKNKTRKVQQCIDKHLGSNNNISFVNAQTDARITLDDKTKFYIRSYPGELKIKFDKEENSFESYTEIRKMCEGIKNIISGKEK